MTRSATGFVQNVNQQVRQLALDLQKKLSELRADVDEITSGSSTVDHGALVGLADDDHPHYARSDGTRGLFEVSGAVATHVAAGDPHTQYLNAPEGRVIANEEIDVHVGLADPHSQYKAALDAHLVDAVDAHDASAVSYDGSGNSALVQAWLTASDLNAAVGQLSGQLYTPDEETTNALIAALNALLTPTELTNPDVFSSDLIVSRHLASGSVIAGKIDAQSITAAEIAANTITTANLAVDAIKSTNYAYTSGSFTDAGSRFDLDNGVIRTPGLYVNGASPFNVAVKGDITAKSLTMLGTSGSPILSLYDSGSTNRRGLKHYSENWYDLDTSAELNLYGNNNNFLPSGDSANAELRTIGPSLHSGAVQVASGDTMTLASLIAEKSGSGQRRASVAALNYTSFNDAISRMSAGFVGGTDAVIEVRSNGADVTAAITAATGITMNVASKTVELAANAKLRDHDNRQFVRGATESSGSTLVPVFLSGKSTQTTDGFGEITIPLGETFSSAPDVVVTNWSTSGRVASLRAIYTTSFVVRITTSAGAAATGSNVDVSWMAFGRRSV